MKKHLLILITAIALMLCVAGCADTPSTQSKEERSHVPSEFVTEALEEYVVYEGEVEDPYNKIPVEVKTYLNGGVNAVTDKNTPVILYVVNTNTDRVGTTDDETLLKGFLEKNYAVVVLNYNNNKKAVYPGLDHGLQGIKMSFISEKDDMRLEWLGGKKISTTWVYTLPAGYNLTRQANFYSTDRHGSDGDFDWIIFSWNTDFLSNKKNYQITFAQDTKVIKSAGSSEYLEFKAGDKLTIKEYTAMLDGGKVTDITQCLRPDGRVIDMNLYMDIIYPANPEEEVPVMMYAQSSQNTLGTWNSKKERPHVTGFLFRGYAVALYDFDFVPMARDDHYGYYDGNSGNGITGYNRTFGLGIYSDLKVDTAAVRYVRHLADTEGDTYKFALDKFGVLGISKSGHVVTLGNPDVESLRPSRYMEGHSAESRYENGKTEDITDLNGFVIEGGEEQPWLTYKDGTKIPSNVQFTSTNVGSEPSSVVAESAPMYIYGTKESGGSQFSSYPELLSRCYTMDIPAMYYDGLPVGHALNYGPDQSTGNDAYNALFTTADYWLRGMGANCEYIKPLNGTTDVATTETIIVKFTGSVSSEEIAKVTITNQTNTSQEVKGEWKSYYGDTEWHFSPYNFEGGCIYEITVPDTIKGMNGKTVSGMSSRLMTKAETAVVAAEVSENKTATSENGVYVKVTGADVTNAAKTVLRFGVTNDAANIVEVYAADAQKKATTLLGSVNIAGVGEYEVDVTKYVTGGDASFVLKAKKAVGEKVLYSQDFESITDISEASPLKPSGGIQVSIAAYDNGNKGAMLTGNLPFNEYTDEFEKENPDAPQFHQGFSSAFTIYPEKKEFKPEDYGRKFRVEIDVFDTVTRRAGFVSGVSASGSKLDATASKRTYMTQPGLNEYSYEFRADGVLYMKKAGTGISFDFDGAKSSERPVYIDNFVFTEIITDVEIASGENTYTAPSLVSYPAEGSVTLPQFDVTFVDAEGNVLSTTTLPYGSAVTAPDAKPAKEATYDEKTNATTKYTFEGWADDKGNALTDRTKVSGTTTFVPCYAETAELSITGAYTVSMVYEDGTSVENISLKDLYKDGMLTLPTLTRETKVDDAAHSYTKYTFKGWKTSDDKLLEGEQLKLTESVTLVAYFEETTCKITLKRGDKELTGWKLSEYLDLTNDTFQLPKLSVGGFAGWILEGDASSTVKAAGTAVEVTGDLTYVMNIDPSYVPTAAEVKYGKLMLSKDGSGNVSNPVGQIETNYADAKNGGSNGLVYKISKSSDGLGSFTVGGIGTMKNSANKIRLCTEGNATLSIGFVGAIPAWSGQTNGEWIEIAITAVNNDGMWIMNAYTVENGKHTIISEFQDVVVGPESNDFIFSGTGLTGSGDNIYIDTMEFYKN